MSLYEQWKEELENQTDETFEAFWDKYRSGETRIYSSILGKGNPVVQDQELQRNMKGPVISRIWTNHTSLRTLLSLNFKDSITPTDFESCTSICSGVDYHTLEEWNPSFPEKRQESLGIQQIQDSREKPDRTTLPPAAVGK